VALSFVKAATIPVKLKLNKYSLRLDDIKRGLMNWQKNNQKVQNIKHHSEI